MNQICNFCKKGQLQLVTKDEPWHDDYLICQNCFSTYNIDYDNNNLKKVHMNNQFYMDDVGSISLSAAKHIKDKLAALDVYLTDNQYDDLFKNIYVLLEPYSNGDYRGYN